MNAAQKESVLNRWRCLFLVFMVLLAFTAWPSGCDDSEYMTNYYRSYADAVSDGAIQRGWIPELVPASAFEISEQHDLDTNEIWIRFRTDPEDEAAMLAGMTRLEPEEIGALEVDYPGDREMWFDRLSAPESGNSGGIEADVYSGTCDGTSVFSKSYLVKDRNSSYFYYWCGQ